ncbi:hypothetical protein ACU01Y_004736 [Salmonella enterica subsp. enterica serovar Newport]
MSHDLKVRFPPGTWNQENQTSKKHFIAPAEAFCVGVMEAF